MNRSLPCARLLILGLILLALAAPAQADPGEALDLLRSKSMNDRVRAVQLLGQDDSSVSTEILKALQDGLLFIHSPSGAVVRAVEQGGQLVVTDLLSSTTRPDLPKAELSRVATSNAIRSQLQSILSLRDLTNPDPAVRRLAAAGLSSKIRDVDLEFLETRLTLESDDQVRISLETVIALKRLTSGNTDDMDATLDLVGGSLDPPVLAALNAALEQTEDPATAQVIAKAIKRIQTKTSWFGFAETLFFGASLGSVLVLSAIGLAITFGVMGVINMAHGELMMIGAYTTYVIQQLMPNHIDLSLFVAIPAAFVLAGLVGILIERGIIRFLYGRPLETLLATFGVSLVLQQTVRTVFSPLNRSVATPGWMSGSWQINPIFSLTWNRLAIIVFCLLVFAALFAILRRTRLGLEVRAVSQNRAMARAMGTRAALVDALTFGLGSGIAGMAGVALSQLTNVGPNLGQAYIIDSFMVVVFGGVGNLWGTLVAGLGLGVINKVLEPVSGAVLAKILVLIFIILFIQKRPTGLFPQKGRAIED
jgi:urea transport system permease protein